MKVADFRCTFCGKVYEFPLPLPEDAACYTRDDCDTLGYLERVFSDPPVGHFHGSAFSRSSTGASTALRHSQEKALHPMEEPKVRT